MATPIGELIVRSLDGLLSSAAYVSLFVSFYRLYRAPAVGHRKLMGTFAMVFLFRAVANLHGAFAWLAVAGMPTWSGTTLYVSATVGMMYLAWVVHQDEHDLIITLRTSEAQDRIRHEREDDRKRIRQYIDDIDEIQMVQMSRMMRKRGLI